MAIYLATWRIFFTFTLFFYCYTNHIVNSRRFGLHKFPLYLNLFFSLFKITQIICPASFTCFLFNLQAAAFCLRLVQLGPRAFQHGTTGETNNKYILEGCTLDCQGLVICKSLSLSLHYSIDHFCPTK